MRSWQRYAAALLLLVAAGVIQQSVWVLRLFDHGQPGSGLMPFGLGVILGVLAIALFVANLGHDADRKPFWESGAWHRPLLAVAITAAYTILFDDIGAITSVFVLVAGWLAFVERKSVVVSLATGAATAIVVYLVFVRFLQTPFPQGWLF